MKKNENNAIFGNIGHVSLQMGGSPEVMDTGKCIAAVHADCDFLLQYYDMRKVARTGEVDAMSKVKDVLNGASYS